MNQREWAIAILENRIEDAEKNTENEHMSCAVSAEQLRTVLLALRASPSEAVERDAARYGKVKNRLTAPIF